MHIRRRLSALLKVTVGKVPRDEYRISLEFPRRQLSIQQNRRSIAARGINVVGALIGGKCSRGNLAPQRRQSIELPLAAHPHSLDARLFANHGEGGAAVSLRIGLFGIAQKHTLAGDYGIGRSRFFPFASRRQMREMVGELILHRLVRGVAKRVFQDDARYS